MKKLYRNFFIILYRNSNKKYYIFSQLDPREIFHKLPSKLFHPIQMYSNENSHEHTPQIPHPRHKLEIFNYSPDKNNPQNFIPTITNIDTNRGRFSDTRMHKTHTEIRPKHTHTSTAIYRQRTSLKHTIYIIEIIDIANYRA